MKEEQIYYLTLWLAGIIIFVFTLQQIFNLNLAWTVGTFDPRFFLSMLAHSGMAHLLGNLFGLIVFGLILEGVIGSKKLGIVLLCAGIIGNLAGIGSYNRVLGFSGAIYGIFGALTILRPRMVVWVSGMPMPMVVAAIGWVFVDFIGLFANTNTGHLAHLAGLVGGVILGITWKKDFPEQKKRRKKGRTDPELDRALDRWEETHL